MLIRVSPFDAYLVHHAQAEKNLAKVHGGGDQRLTTRGQAQARALGAYLRPLVPAAGRLRILHQPDGRNEATARHIGAMLATTVASWPAASAIGMGEASGLSDTESAARFPEYAAQLAAWYRRGCDVGTAPQPPGGEAPAAFAARIRQALLALVDTCDGDAVVFVGSTTTLSIMHHVFAHNGDLVPSDSNTMDFPLGSIAGWRLSAEAPTLFLPLTRPPLEPDTVPASVRAESVVPRSQPR